MSIKVVRMGLSGILLSWACACGHFATGPLLESQPVAEGGDAPSEPTPPQSATASPASPASHAAPAAEQPDGGSEARYFYSFARSNPRDPEGMQRFGSDQTQLVSDAVASLPGVAFSMDVETNPLAVRVSDIKSKLAALRDQVTERDTVIIYTHSHGLLPGLGIDWETQDKARVTFKWEDYAEAIVSLPAKNVVVFTMACHSGYLAAAVQKIAHKWKDSRKKMGRSLIVLTAVSAEQLSKPTDQNLTSGIGNPFNYAVRTALKGAADGAVDGIRDGKTNFEELVQYVLRTAKDKSTDSYAEPQFAGEYVAAEQLL